MVVVVLGVRVAVAIYNLYA